MDKLEDHGGVDANNPFCKYCTDDQGNLLPKDQVRAKMIQFYIQKQSKTQEEAEKLTDQLMSSMAAWKGDGGSAALGTSEPTTPLATEPAPTPTPEPIPTSEPAPEMPTEPAPKPEPIETPVSSPIAGEEPVSGEEQSGPTSE